MVKVIGVKFRNSGRVYYFDPGDLDIQPGSGVIVETARGVEYGDVTMGVTEVEEEKVVSPLKTVQRIATDEDRRLRRSAHRSPPDRRVVLQVISASTPILAYVPCYTAA